MSDQVTCGHARASPGVGKPGPRMAGGHPHHGATADPPDFTQSQLQKIPSAQRRRVFPAGLLPQGPQKDQPLGQARLYPQPGWHRHRRQHPSPEGAGYPASGHWGRSRFKPSPPCFLASFPTRQQK